MNAIAGVEDVETILDASQQRYMARCIADPSTTEDIRSSESEIRQAMDRKRKRHLDQPQGKEEV